MVSAVFKRRCCRTCPGGLWNEDAVGGGDSYLYVLDGATGLTEGPPRMDPHSDAAWLVRETAQWLEVWLPHQEVSLEEILTQAMARLLAQWTGPLEELPSAGVAIFRQRGGKIEYLGLGDCEASLLDREGTFRAWREESLTALDHRALVQAMKLARETGTTLRESLPEIQPLLRRHRALRNTPQGYWILDPTGVGIPHARRGEFPLQNCRSLFLCTDGLAQCMGFGLARDLPELHKQALNQGLDPLLQALWTRQARDADLEVLPRFKIRDDASGAVCSVGL